MKHFVVLTLVAASLLACGNNRCSSCATRGEGDDAADKNGNTKVVPDRYTYSVINSFPHLTTSYTQGLQYIDGVMWEGTGLRGRSRLQRIDLDSGKAEVVASLPDDEFGEGITVLGERIYQLTWQNRKVHVYDRGSGSHLYELPYKGEGWGLTSDGERLYMSDGTDKIRVIDPENFEQTGLISVLCNGESLFNLNELEWIEGMIWANVYTADQIAVINPESGVVEGVVDLTGILPKSEQTALTDVLNGIAYDSEGKRIFVTGKNWSRLFEIEIFKQ